MEVCDLTICSKKPLPCLLFAAVNDGEKLDNKKWIWLFVEGLRRSFGAHAPILPGNGPQQCLPLHIGVETAVMVQVKYNVEPESSIFPAEWLEATHILTVFAPQQVF